jgi:hypothetical protein
MKLSVLQGGEAEWPDHAEAPDSLVLVRPSVTIEVGWPPG